MPLPSEAFSGITEKNPEYKEKLKQPLELKGNLLKDFGVFAIIEWLKRLSASTFYLDGYGRSPPRVIFNGKNPAYILSKKLIDQNLFLKSIESPFPLNLPENTTIRVENGEVVLDSSLMKITISVRFNQWLKGVDLRIKHLLNVSEEDLKDYATISGIISFDAEFKFRSIFSREADKYYVYSKRILENLRCNYSWSELIKNVKEAAFWKHVLNHE